MLLHLYIKNYALIQALEIQPSKHMNVITGETGAGKSIMLGAVGLLLGQRADTKVLLDQSHKCIVEGTFDISEYQLAPVFQEEELDYENPCILRREISPGGKSRAFVNDTPVNLASLRKIGSRLMDIHSQHDTLQLALSDFQLMIVDTYAGNQPLLTDYQSHYQRYLNYKNEHTLLSTKAEELKKEADYNHFLWEELAKARLEDDEQEALEEELKLLEHAEEVQTNLQQISHLMDKTEQAVIPTLYIAGNHLNNIVDYGDKFETLKERVESCLIELKDIHEEIEREGVDIIFDPKRIEDIKERLSMFYQLQQKHKVSTNKALIDIRDQLEESIQKTASLDETLEQLQVQMEKAYHHAHEKANILSAARKEVFGDITDTIKNLLAGLGMEEASLKIDTENKPLSTNGVDDIRFLFSANKGITPQALGQVASGGEFSRLMFCFKYLLADKTALPSIIFDEIDSGISGEVAIKMAKMMKEMAQNHQVISISHLPQVAAKGDVHYFVYKDNSTERTSSKIKKLSEEGRIQEIAQMIAGEKPSAAAFENAKELLLSSS